MQQTNIKIALIAADGLGDSILQIVLAQNLSRCGFEVDVYQKLIHTLNPMINLVNVFAIDPQLANHLNHYDVVLVDKGAAVVKTIWAQTGLRAKCMVYSISKSNPNKQYVNGLFEQKNLSALQTKFLQQFNGKSFRLKFSRNTIPQQFVQLIQRDFPDTALSSEPDLSIPTDWQKNQYQKRILIHPTSSSSSKNWHIDRFIALYDRLEQSGYKPYFSIAPSEVDEFNDLFGEHRRSAVFNSIAELAKFYYESGGFIGNDSGNGHLASLVGLPTISIFNARKRHFAWRPAWGDNEIVRPILSRRLVGKQHWQSSLSVEKVYQAFLKLHQASRIINAGNK